MSCCFPFCSAFASFQGGERGLFSTACELAHHEARDGNDSGAVMFMRGLLVGTPISVLLWYGIYRAWIATTLSTP
jgi:hypothetical protein